MDSMPRPRPPHLQWEKTRHGKVVWYVKIGKGLRIRIRAAFGSPEFDAEYQAAITGTARPAKTAPAAGTFGWLIARYRETTSWAALSVATRRQRENILRQVIETAGVQPIARITTTIIVAGRERRMKTPHQARHFLDAMRGLFQWAMEAKLVKSDPTAGVKNPPRKNGPDSRCGLRRTWRPMSGVGPLAHANVFGSMCWLIRDCAAAMLSGWDARMCATASPPSRPKRVASLSR